MVIIKYVNAIKPLAYSVIFNSMMLILQVTSMNIRM